MAANAADIRAGGAYVELSAKGESQVSGALKRVRSNLEKLSQSALAAGLKLGAIGAGMAYSMRKPIEAAANFEETLSKFKAVFKDQADEASKWAKTLADGIGRSETATMNYMASFQDIFVPMGFAREEATKLSKVVAQLGYDLASFGNRNDAETMERILGGLIGNHLNLRAFGVSIMESSLNAELMAMGLAKGTKQATEQQKVLARLRILLRGTSDAHGDAANTASSFTNTLKRLEAKFEETQIAIGKVLNEALKPYISMLANAAESAKKMVETNPEIVSGFLKLTAAILGTASALLAFAGASALVGFLLTPLGLVAAALVYISGLFDFLAEQLGNFGDFWKEVWGGIKSYISSIWNSILAGFSGMMAFLLSGLSKLEKAALDIANRVAHEIDMKLKNAGIITLQEFYRREESRQNSTGWLSPAADYFGGIQNELQAMAAEDKAKSKASFKSAVAPLFGGLKSLFEPDALELPTINIPGLPDVGGASGGGGGGSHSSWRELPGIGVTGFFGSTSGREMGGGGNSLGQRQLSVSQTMSWTLKSIDSKIGNMVASYA